MASQVLGQTVPVTVLKKAPEQAGLKKAATPQLDEQGNIIIPQLEDKIKPLRGNYYETSPIPRLAAAAAFKTKDQIPTAGGYGIEVVKPAEIDIPPECYLYDEDRPWVLGKLSPAALDLPEPAEPVPFDMKKLEKVLAKYDKKGGSTDATPGAKSQTEAGVKLVKKKSKSKNPSPSPTPKPKTGKSVSPSPTRSLKMKRAPSKSPVPPTSAAEPAAGKLTVSPRSGSKKIVNAKYDLEIIERKHCQDK